MRRVVIESPYAGDVERNLKYLRAAMLHCLLKNESPYASHGLLTQENVLDDNEPDDRFVGITAGFAWAEVADAVVFYIDFGMSNGMIEALKVHEAAGRTVEYRSLR